MSDAEAAVRIDRVVTTDPETARVVGSEIRAKLLDLLATDSHTVGSLQAGLADRGEQLAETSVRHHVGVLADAEMVAVVRREDVNGGTRKHYRATTRAYAFDSTGAEDALSSMHGLVRAELLSLLSRLGATHREDLEAAAAALAADDCYEHGDRRAYVVRELVDRVLTDLETSGTLDDRLPPLH